MFVRNYGFLPFAKNMGKSIGKNIRKILSGKHSHKDLDQPKQSATNALTTTPKVIQKTAEATDDLIGNKIANTIMKVSISSPQNSSKTVTNEHDKEIPTYLQKKHRKLLMK